MKKKIVLVCCIGTILLGVGAGVAIAAPLDYPEWRPLKSINEPLAPQPRHQGGAKYCFFYIETSSADGIPDTPYSGTLKNVNITVYGSPMFSVVPFPWFIFASFFETEDQIDITMSFFYGFIDQTENDTMISGFARDFEWEW